MYSNFLNSFTQFIKFLFHFNGLVIVAKLPRTEYEKTGYYHRVCAIDEVFSDIPLVYADWNITLEDSQEDINFDIKSTHKKRVIWNITHPWYLFLTLICVLRCRKIYFHHVAGILPIFKILVRLPFITSFIDFHGAAPEEHAMVGIHDKISKMIELEKFALRHINYGIIVTKAMQIHLKKKYSKNKICIKFILLPIIRSYLTNIPPKKIEKKYSVIYAGNAQIWQQIPLMMNAISKTFGKYNFVVCCTNFKAIDGMTPKSIKGRLNTLSVNHVELLKLYTSCHYGFALRDESVVNRVACPTKIVEYLAYGIIPILNSPDIGDFQQLGMQYVSLDSFIKGDIPAEDVRQKIVGLNWDVFMSLRQQYLKGSHQLFNVVTQ